MPSVTLKPILSVHRKYRITPRYSAKLGSVFSGASSKLFDDSINIFHWYCGDKQP